MIRGAPIVAFMVCLGVGVMAWNLAGMSAVVGPSATDDLQTGGELERQANDSAANQGFNSSTGDTGDGDLVGVILTGIGSLASVLRFAVLLPWELERLGLPWFGAYPIGLAAQLILSIAFVQAASNRVFR